MSQIVDVIVALERLEESAARFALSAEGGLFDPLAADLSALQASRDPLRTARMLAIENGLPQPLIDELTAALLSNLMPAGVALIFSADDLAGDQLLAEALEVVAAHSRQSLHARIAFEVARARLRSPRARLDDVLRTVDRWATLAGAGGDAWEKYEAYACAAAEYQAVGDAATSRRFIEMAIAERGQLAGAVLPDLSEIDAAKRQALERGNVVTAARVDFLARLRANELYLAYTEANNEARHGDANKSVTLLMSALPDAYHAGTGEEIEVNLAESLVRAGRVDEAERILTRLLPAFDAQEGLRMHRATALAIRARISMHAGDLNAALATIDQARADLEFHPNPEVAWEVEAQRVDVLVQLGRSAEAFAAACEGIDVAGHLRRAPLGYRLDNLWLQDKIPLFHRAIRLGVEVAAAEQVCRLIDEVKSRTLSAVLHSSGAGPRLSDELVAVNAELDALELEILRSTPRVPVFTFPDGIQRGAGRAAPAARRTALLVTRAALLAQVQLHDPRWGFLSEAVPANVEEAVALLFEAKRSALQLFLDDSVVTAALIHQGQISVERRKLQPEAAASLARYQVNLTDPRPDLALADVSVATGLTAADIIPPKLLRRALDTDALIVLPHGPLNTLPWPALRYDGKRLFDYCPVGVLPNLVALTSLGRKALAPEPRVALIGAPNVPELDSIPYAAEEIKRLAGMYGADRLVTTPMSGDDATSSKLLDLMDDVRGAGAILHVVSHGSAEMDDPMNSGLVMTDGRVDAVEISARRLHYDEVVLSACSSGWRPTELQGAPLVSDEVLGLPGALLEAGARSIFVSIPPALDRETMEFIVEYHQARLNGELPLAALRAAQQWASTASGLPSHAWAGFVVYGFH